MSARTFEVVILGGGPAGCATAIALCRLGLQRVLMVEARSDGGARVGESVPPEFGLALDRLGVRPGFTADGHEPCLGSCSSWGGSDLGFNDFLFNPHGPGWHLDRGRFEDRMAGEARAAGTELVPACSFEGIDVPASSPYRLQLRHRDGSTSAAEARLVVDATGRQSAFARAVGARQLRHDHLICVTAFLRLPRESPLTRLTMLEAVSYGWWYAARLPGERVAVAVGTDPEIVRRLRLRSLEGWLEGLRATDHLAHLAGSAVEDRQLVVRDAPSFVLSRPAGIDWLAVGDAAAACDPICAQGLYNSLSDGLRAANAIAARLHGDTGAMAGYGHSITGRFDDYLANRNHFYRLEQRWENEPFWARRRNRAAAA